METKKCPNCQNEMPGGANLCPYCGTDMNGNTNTTPNSKSSLDDPNTKRGLLVALLAVLGIVIMFAYRAWLGVPIYLVAFFISIMKLRNEHEADGGALDEFIKDCIKNKDIGIKIMTIIVLLLPLVLIIGTYCYIYVDTERQVNSYFGNIGIFQNLFH